MLALGVHYVANELELMRYAARAGQLKRSIREVKIYDAVRKVSTLIFGFR